MKIRILLSGLVGCVVFAACSDQDVKNDARSEIAMSRYVEVMEIVQNGYNMNDIHHTIFNGIKDGKLQSYQNGVFADPHTQEDIDWMLHQEEVVTLRPDPDDPAYTKDSVIKTELHPQDIPFYRLVETYNRDGNVPVYNSQILGLTLIYSPWIEGEELALRPFAFIKLEDLEAFLGEEKFNAFKKMLITAIEQTELKTL